MAIFIKLQPSTFKGEGQQDRWIARTVSQGEVHTDQIAEAIEHNTSFKKADVVGVLTELIDTMTHQLQDGKTVVLDGFGRFHLSVQGTSVGHPRDFSIKKNVRSVKCNFVPAGHRDSQDHTLRKTFLANTEVKMLPKYKQEKS